MEAITLISWNMALNEMQNSSEKIISDFFGAPEKTFNSSVLVANALSRMLIKIRRTSRKIKNSIDRLVRDIEKNRVKNIKSVNKKLAKLYSKQEQLYYQEETINTRLMNIV